MVKVYHDENADLSSRVKGSPSSATATRAEPRLKEKASIKL